MLTPADADLCRRDPALPGLPLVLDAPALAAALAGALPGLRVSAARATYLRYKPGLSCLAAFEFCIDGRPEPALVHAEAYAAAARDKYAKRSGPAPVPGALGPGYVHLEAHAVVVRAFPNDRELPALRGLAEPARLARLLARLDPAADPATATLRPLAYKPARRLVARVDLAGRPWAVLRAHTEATFARALAGARAFSPRPGLRLPPLLGKSSRHALLAVGFLPGRPLTEALAEPAATYPGPDLLAPVARALADLHAQRARLRPARPVERAAAIRQLARWLGHLRPDLAQAAARAATELAGRLADADGDAPDVPSHGDFYAGQVLLPAEFSAGLSDGAPGAGHPDADDAGAPRLAILDLDEACRAPAVLDLANFAAHLEADALLGRLPADRVGPLVDALVEAYADAAGRAPAPHFGAHTAAALYALAADPFRRRVPGWPDATRRILDRAAELLCQPSRAAAVPARTTPASPAPLDPAMPFLDAALDPARARPHLQAALAAAAAGAAPRTGHDPLVVHRAELSRHKPGRRALVEYGVTVGGRALTLIGKSRAKGLDRHTPNLHRALRAAGFDDDAPDGLCVPAPAGVVPAFEMWLQEKVAGQPLTAWLSSPRGPELCHRAADLAHKLHRAGVPPRKAHALADEMRILRDRLGTAAAAHPSLAPAAARILARAADLAASLAPAAPPPAPIHRDFYPDQVLVADTRADTRAEPAGRAAAPRLYLIDLDLYCAGDPALDFGNFIAHVREYALRAAGHPDALAPCADAMRSRALALDPGLSPRALDAWTWLSLARHVYISTLFADRRPHTAALAEYLLAT